MPKRQKTLEEDFDLYDESFENAITEQLTRRANRAYNEDTGFNNFDNEKDTSSWKMDALW